MNKILKLIFALLLTNCILFGANETLRTIPIIEIDGALMPGWEKKINELYHDEEGNPIPVVFRSAAKNWEAAGWTPGWFAENFGDKEIQVDDQDLVNNGGLQIDTTIRDHIKDITLNSNNAGYWFVALAHI